MRKMTGLLMAGILVIGILSGCDSNKAARDAAGKTEPAGTEAPEPNSGQSKETGGQSEADHSGKESAEQVKGAVYQLKAGHSQAATHPFQGTLEHFAELVSEKTDGQVEVTIFPNSQLGDEQTMMDSLKMGTLDILLANASNTASHIPEMGMLNVCYLFEDEEHLQRVADDEQIYERYVKLVEDKGVGFSLMNIMGNGVRELYTARPVNSMEDLKGLKIRIMPSATDNEIWSSLGTTPTTVAFNEVYTALQTKMVDGAENTLSSYAASKHNEVAPYVTLTDHQWLMTQLWISDKTKEKLPEEMVTAIYEAAKETSAFALKLQLEVDGEYRKQLEADGVTFTQIDIQPMKDIIYPLQDKIAKELGTEDILDRIRELR